MPKVSVIIPTYNRTNYICEAIDSVLAQTYKDFEIIVVDDGSTDNTREVLSKYDGKIRYFFQENEGEASARNKGIKEAKGEYVAFLDSDDFYLSEKLKTQVGVLDNYSDIAMTYSFAKRIDINGKILDVKPTKPALIPKDFLEGKTVPMTVLVRRECFEKIGLFDENIIVGVDTDMWLRLSLKFKINCTNKPLAIIRTHSGNISSSYEQMYLGHIRIIQKLINDGVENNFNKSLMKNLLAKNFYNLSRVYFHESKKFKLSLKFSLKAIMLNLLVGKNFITLSEPLSYKIKKILNPYGIFLFNLIHLLRIKKEKNIEKILFYEPSSGFGGSGNSLFNLLNHLDKKKFRPVMVICNAGPQFKKIKDLGIEIIKFNSSEIELEENEGILSYLKFGFDLLFNVLPISLKLVSLIKRYKIDLVHINTNIISGIPAILATRILGIPCICHIRQTRRFINREIFFARLVDNFIFINHKAKEFNSDFITEEKAKVIYDGVDLYNFVLGRDSKIREEFNLDSSPTIGIVGRIVEGKGHDDFIKAASIVRKERPEVKFFIVGSDPNKDKALERCLKDLAEKLNLNGSLIFTGWRDDIPEIISTFDINVQPYISPEGLPNVIIEAMACSKPVIATNIPGPSEIVVHNETGLLVPPAEPQALAETIIKLLDNPELAKRMGEAGRKRAEELFDIKKNVKKIEEIYEEVLKEK